MSSQSDLDAIKAERGRVYGDPALSHENIGLAWTGLIQQHYGVRLDHPLPSWLVSLMMVQFKAQRASRVYHKDNFDDLHNYAGFAEEGQRIGSDFGITTSAGCYDVKQPTLSASARTRRLQLARPLRAR